MKKVFEDEILMSMQSALIKNASSINYDEIHKVAGYLNSAIEIFEDLNMHKTADQIVDILLKIGNKDKPDELFIEDLDTAHNDEEDFEEESD